MFLEDIKKVTEKVFEIAVTKEAKEARRTDLLHVLRDAYKDMVWSGAETEDMADPLTTVIVISFVLAMSYNLPIGKLVDSLVNTLKETDKYISNYTILNEVIARWTFSDGYTIIKSSEESSDSNFVFIPMYADSIIVGKSADTGERVEGYYVGISENGNAKLYNNGKVIECKANSLSLEFKETEN